jgi:hypothetical protein
LLLRLSVLFLLRAEERNQSVVLFHEPPRIARHSSVPVPAEQSRSKQAAAQSQGIGLAGMTDPALHPRVEVLPIHAAASVGSSEAAQATGESVAVVIAQQAKAGKHPIAEYIDPIMDPKDIGLTWVDAQPQGLQSLLDRLAPGMQLGLVVGQQQEIIDVAQVGLDPQLLFDGQRLP